MVPKKFAKIETLTSMRFFAIMLVVITHFHIMSPAYYSIGSFSWKMWPYLHNANLGVDFFFILSGFGLMYSSIYSQKFNDDCSLSVKDCFLYAINHIKKIYPLYVFTTILMLFITFFHYFTYYDKTFKHFITFLLIKLFACITLLQSVVGSLWLSRAFNGVGWFISCLFLIYIFSPIYIKLLKKYCNTIKKCLLMLPILIILSVIFAYIGSRIEVLTGLDDVIYGTPYRRFLYVVFGMVLAILYTQLLQTNNNINKNLINFYETGAMLLFLSWIPLRNYVKFLLPYRSLIYIFDMVIVGLAFFLLAIQKGYISKLFLSPKLIYLGNISMYIFLIHFPVMSYLAELFKSFNFQSNLAAMWYIIIVLVITFVISDLLYRKSKIKN